MHPPFFEALVEELSRIWWLEDLPEWIPCMDSDILRYLPSAAERRKWLRKAKAEITRRRIQERVDEITEAWERDDEISVQVLMDAFPKDLEVHKELAPSQRKRWIDKATFAACGRTKGPMDGESVIYFISAGDDLVKIGHTTSLRSRLRSLRTSSPKEIRVLLVIAGNRDCEQELHRRFAAFRVCREWFKRSGPVDEFIARHRACETGIGVGFW
jgi:hypothetical protein